MSLSRTDRTERRLLNKYEDFTPAPAPWVRKQQEAAHWYEQWKAGYRPKAWPKRNDNCDDGRFDLVEKEQND